MNKLKGEWNMGVLKDIVSIVASIVAIINGIIINGNTFRKS